MQLFFPQDFTEVDHNVTRHVPHELEQDDWSAMILHYLGLDHIGHKTGPHGPNMLPKQKEMDDIVKAVYEAMEGTKHQANTLLVLAGDHGMNAGGNHGGSGPGETEPALLFVSPKFRNMQDKRRYDCPTEPEEGTEFHFYTKVEQSDLVPSLAGLLGLPVPRNNLGVFIDELKGLWPPAQQVQLLRQNARQIRDIVDAAYGSERVSATITRYSTMASAGEVQCTDAGDGEHRLACLWVAADSSEDMETSSLAWKQFLAEAQDTMSGAASSYNIPNMMTGMGITAAIFALSLYSTASLWPPTTSGVCFAVISLLYGVMMFTSSYVEEEQHFWYWLTPAWVLLLGLQHSSDAATGRRLSMGVLAMLAVHRFALRWNQTGQKHAGEPDIVHAFFPQAHILMWLLVLATYCFQGYDLVTKTFAGILAIEFSLVATVTVIVPAIVFKLNFTQADAPELVQGLATQFREWTEIFDLVIQARVVFITLVLIGLAVTTLSVASHRASVKYDYLAGALPTLTERLHPLLTLFLMTQTRAPNIPLFLGLEAQRRALLAILSDAVPSTLAASRRVTTIATTTLLLSHTYFFCMGGSNSISSIDLSNAYNGVADYNIAAVGILLFASNWTAPIWWCSAACLLLTSKPRRASPPRALTKTDERRAWVMEEREKLHAQSLRVVMGQEKAPSQGQASAFVLWHAYLACMTAFVAASLLGVMAACTALRAHLFIWTVFSPKYLYAMAWSVGWHLIVNVGLGSLLMWLSGIA